MKSIKKIIIIATCVILAACSSGNDNSLNEENDNPKPESKYIAGTYTSESYEYTAADTYTASFKAIVTVSDTEILEIILEYECPKTEAGACQSGVGTNSLVKDGSLAEYVKKGLEGSFDGISGATMSYETATKAVEDALSQASN